MAQRQEMTVLLLLPLKEQQLCGRVVMNTVSAVDAVQTTSARSCEDENAQSWKVRACKRTLSAVIARLPPCLPRAAWLPNPDSHFF